MIKTRKEDDSFRTGGIKCSKTKQSQEWKAEIGLNTWRKISTTKQSQEWKINNEQERIEKCNTTMYLLDEDFLSKRDLRNIKDSETKQSQKWKEEVGFEQYKNLSKVRLEQGLVKGKNNPNTKKINILNSNNEIMFESYGDFKKICLDNKLPFESFKHSYQNNTKLYESETGKKRVKNTPNEKYIGWSAKLG